MKCKVCKNNLKKSTICPLCKSDQNEKLILSTLGVYLHNAKIQQQELSNSVSCFLLLTDKRFLALDSYRKLNSPVILENLIGARAASNIDLILINTKLDDIVDVEITTQREWLGKKETCTIITKDENYYSLAGYSTAFSRQLEKLVNLGKPQAKKPEKAVNLFYSDAVKQALNIAYQAHEKQKDKAGIPYIFHPFQIAQKMTDETAICVALLHDVLEDSQLTAEDLEKQGVASEVIMTLKLLKHEKTEAYTDYIQRIKDSGNAVAIAVKLADLRHNSDTNRLPKVDEKTRERIEKYSLAIKLLEMSDEND